MFDLKITGGTVVDGTGAERYQADIAILDGKIVDVVRRGAGDPALGGEAAETIDATGHVVAPGFVDIHTHYDGQVTWDSLLEPSSGHGVTTLPEALRLAPNLQVARVDTVQYAISARGFNNATAPTIAA